MRLGGFVCAGTRADLPGICDALDRYGLSAISAPWGFEETMSDEECIAYGETARTLGMVVGEAGMWMNLLTPNSDLQDNRIAQTRAMLRKADLMGCHCIVSLVGTKDPSDAALAPHPYNYSSACRTEFREVVLRILDGLELKTVRYAIEPWHNTFFYQPEDIRAFIDDIDHPSFGLHLDQMNMVNQQNFYDTTTLINSTFDLLADKVVSVHLKDIRCDYNHMFLKWDEVTIGTGVMDYQTYLTRLAALPADTPCYCEHMAEERDYAMNFARLHHLSALAGVHFLPRSPKLEAHLV